MAGPQVLTDADVWGAPAQPAATPAPEVAVTPAQPGPVVAPAGGTNAASPVTAAALPVIAGTQALPNGQGLPEPAGGKLLTDEDVWGGAAAPPPVDPSHGTDGPDVGNPWSNLWRDWRDRATAGEAQYKDAWSKGFGRHIINGPLDQVLANGGAPETLSDLGNGARFAGGVMDTATAPFMAFADQIGGRPVAVIANKVNDATGIAPGYVADPHAITDVASVVAPFADAALTNRAVSAGAKAAGITEQAYVERQAAQRAAADAAAAAAKKPGVLQGAAKAVDATVGPFVAAVSKTAAERQAAQKLAASASDMPAARTAISTADNGGVVVPGSSPTTAELTGDMGLSALQRGVATKKPDLFADRAAEQSAARTTALHDLQPDGDPMDFANAVKGQFDALDARHAAEIEAAQQAGAQAVADTAAAHDATVAGATQTAQTAAEGIGGTNTPDVQGAALRDSLQNAADASKAAYGALYKAVDPTGTMVVDASPVAASAGQIRAQIPKTSEPMGAGEGAIFDTAAQLGPGTSMGDAMAFRVRVGQAATQAKMVGDNVQAARLNALKASIDDALAGRVAQQVASDQQAVAAGQMAPEDAIAARMQSDAAGWLQQRAQARATAGGGNPANPGSGAASVLGGDRAAVPAGGSTGPAPGSPGVPEAGGAAPFDPGAADRLNAANSAFAQHQRTFGATPVAQVMKTRAGYTNDGADFVMPDGSVPSRVWKPGPGGFDTVGAVVKASPDALPLIEDVAASSLRTDAMRPDGTLDPDKFAAWQRKYGDALRALPDATKARFQDAASASDALAEAAANRTAAIKATQDQAAASVLAATNEGKAALAAARQSAPGKFLDRTEPEDVSGAVGSLLGRNDAVAQMGQLADAARGDDVATAGLQRAVFDHLVGRLMSQTEAGTTGVNSLKANSFQAYLAAKRQALAKVLTQDQLDRLQAISDDIARSRRSQSAVSLKNGSTTMQDAHSGGLGASVAGHVSQTMLTSMMALMGEHHGGMLGLVIGGAGGATLQALRAVGVHRVDDLVTRALLDPDVFMRLTSRLPENPAAAAKVYPDRLRALTRALAVSQGLSQRQRRPSDPIPQRR